MSENAAPEKKYWNGVMFVGLPRCPYEEATRWPSGRRKCVLLDAPPACGWEDDPHLCYFFIRASRSSKKEGQK